MDILIFGGGAIGSHLAYCLNDNKNNIYLIARGLHLKKIIKDGLKIKIYQNEILKRNVLLKQNKKITFHSNTDLFKNKKFDFIFITVKLKDFNKKLINKLNKNIDKNTAIVPPCTELPDWWFSKILGSKKNNLKKYQNQNFFLRYKKNIIGMTMWLSAIMKRPGLIKVNHIQRGYPLKEIDNKMKIKANILRSIINKKCTSPKVQNIYSEIYIKVINSFAFNLIALKTEFNNYQIKKSQKTVLSIRMIMMEFENIVSKLGLPVYQSINSRIKQTLSSEKHTMSMLTDFKNKKKIELKFSFQKLFLLSKLSGLKIDYSKKMYNLTLKKIYDKKK
tara:strand:+ start:2344 stop:3342 length:999 start_codon:yes stop_codon:yes gene_type:complete